MNIIFEWLRRREEKIRESDEFDTPSAEQRSIDRAREVSEEKKAIYRDRIAQLEAKREEFKLVYAAAPSIVVGFLAIQVTWLIFQLQQKQAILLIVQTVVRTLGSMMLIGSILFALMAIDRPNLQRILWNYDRMLGRESEKQRREREQIMTKEGLNKQLRRDMMVPFIVALFAMVFLLLAH